MYNHKAHILVALMSEPHKIMDLPGIKENLLEVCQAIRALSDDKQIACTHDHWHLLLQLPPGMHIEVASFEFHKQGNFYAYGIKFEDPIIVDGITLDGFNIIQYDGDVKVLDNDSKPLPGCFSRTIPEALDVFLPYYYSLANAPDYDPLYFVNPRTTSLPPFSDN